MSNRTPLLSVAIFGVLIAAGAAVWMTFEPAAAWESPVSVKTDLGFTELPDGRGGTIVEAIVYTSAMGFDRQRSLQAFETTVYRLRRENCSGSLLS